jgi:hypothetical protein
MGTSLSLSILGQDNGGGHAWYEACTHARLRGQAGVKGDGTSFRRQAHIDLQELDTRGQLFQLGHVHRGTNVAIKDSQGNSQRGDSVGHVDNAADPTFAGNARQEEVNLFFRVAKLGQVLDAIEDGHLVGNGGICKTNSEKQKI